MVFRRPSAHPRLPACVEAVCLLLVHSAFLHLFAGVGSSAGADEGASAFAAEQQAVDLEFGELFKTPVGPRGLEYSEKAFSLAGKRVRIRGHMVRQARPIPWCFLFSPVPQTLHEREYGLADDLPMNCLHIRVPKSAAPIVQHRPGSFAITGVLEIGPQEEADERRSVARVIMNREDVEAARLVPTPKPAAVQTPPGTQADARLIHLRSLSPQ